MPKQKPKKKVIPPRRCVRCGSLRLRLEIPPDFEAFEVCRDCGKIQREKID